MRENLDTQPEIIEGQYTPEQPEFILPPQVVDDIVTPDSSPVTAGKIAIATQSEVNAGVNTAKAVVPETLANSVWAKKKFSQTFGNTVLTVFTLNHNFGTRDVQVEVMETSGNFKTIVPGATTFDVERTTTNDVRLTFVSAPGTNAYRAVCIA